MTRKEKYSLAMKILNENGIETINKTMCVNCFGGLVIHSKRLKNCIIVTPQATAHTIEKAIYRELSLI